MPESRNHSDLVGDLVRWVQEEYSDRYGVCLYCDHPERELPPLVGGVRPDLYAQDLTGSFVVIGEAKTDDDLENEHTRLQLARYLDHLSLNHEPILLLATSINGRATAQSVVKRVIRETGIDGVTVVFLPDRITWIGTKTC